MLTIRDTDDGLAFNVYVQPRASKCAIVGIHQQAIKIRLTAPPVENAANKQCIEVLAKALGLPKSQLTILGGHSHRLKQIGISGKTSPLSKSERNTLKQHLTAIAQTGTN
jgi:uncharacterized protein (TIGR00251 family)